MTNTKAFKYPCTGVVFSNCRESVAPIQNDLFQVSLGFRLMDTKRRLLAEALQCSKVRDFFMKGLVVALENPASLSRKVHCVDNDKGLWTRPSHVAKKDFATMILKKLNTVTGLSHQMSVKAPGTQAYTRLQVKLHKAAIGIILHEDFLAKCLAEYESGSKDFYWVKLLMQDTETEFFNSMEKLGYYFANPVLRKFNVNREELETAARFGIYQAIHHFAPEMGVPFSTVAKSYVSSYVTQEIRNLSTRPLTEREHRLSNSISRLEAEKKTVLEISAELKIDTSRVECIKSRRSPVMSIDSDDGVITVEGKTFDTCCEDDSSNKHLTKLLGETLKPRQAEVISFRFGLGCRDRSLKEIADYYGVSRERVRQIEEGALKTLRASDKSSELMMLLTGDM